VLNVSPNKLSYITRSLPNFLWVLKWYIMRASLKKAGKNFKFGYNSEFADHRLIEVGDNVFMGQHTIINTTVPVKIGNNVMFGPQVTIMGGDHNINYVGKPMRFVKAGGKNIPIVIEDDAWIGTNVTILKGVQIGESAVVGAGSVVVKSLPPYSICIGNPCKPIKLRFSESDLGEHLKLVKSNYTKEQVIELFNSATKK
jgi:acetyltransferase-like isoleucine patch superfamily enzyme